MNIPRHQYVAVRLCLGLAILSIGCAEQTDPPKRAMTSPNSPGPISSPVATPPISDTPKAESDEKPAQPAVAEAPAEDPEFLALVKKRGWPFDRDRFDRRELLKLRVYDNGKMYGAELVLSTEDLKTIAKSKTVQSIDLTRVNKLKNDGLKLLSGMPQLEELKVQSDNITDDGIKVLAALPKLRSLSILWSKINGTGLAPFAESKTLQELELGNVDGFDDVGARIVAKIPNLSALKISTGLDPSAKKLTTEGLRAIVSAYVPKEFHFDHELIDDDVLEKLVAKGWLYGPSQPMREKPEDVKWILLTRSKVTDRGLKSVLPCTGTTMFQLHETAISDETLKKMGGFKSLKVLGLDKSKVTAAGLDVVAAAPIENLQLRGCLITKDHIPVFQKMTTLQTLYINETSLDDDGFRELLKLPKLKELHVEKTKVTRETYQKAKKDHPTLKLSHHEFDK